MHRSIRAIRLVLALAASLAIVAGCAPTGDEEAMGVWGYVTTASNASLEMATEQPGAAELLVDRVVAPEDSWIVVHVDDDGTPGERIGIAPVPRGESSAVRIPFDGADTPQVIVALHADRGTPGEFDFDMDKMMTSPDRPFFVDGAEVAVVVTVR